MAWTINEVMKYKNGPAGQWAGLLEHMIGASAPNPTTLVIRYSTAVANVLEQMQGMSVLPRQVWAPYFTGKGTGIKTFQNVPPANGQPMVSGGPFELVQYKANQYALFKRNPNWWGPKPKIEGFGLQFFSNADAMVQALKDHQVDFIGEYTPPTAVTALKKAGFVVTTTPSLSMKTFIINTNPHKTTHRELLNPLVREAIEYATDRQQIIKTAWLGLAQPGSTIIAPADGSWHDPNIKCACRSTWRRPASCSTRPATRWGRTGCGSPTATRCSTASSSRRTSAAQATARSRSCSRTCRRSASRSPSRTWTTARPSTPSRRRTASTRPSTWRCGTGCRRSTPTSCSRSLTCAQLGNNSDSGYCNPNYDRMYARQSTLLDPSARRELIWQMQQYIYSARPYIILDYPDIIEAHSPNWTGFTVSPVMGSVNSLSTQTLLQVHQS